MSDEYRLSDETSTEDPTRTPPGEVFSLIGNEVRAEVLRVLGEDPYSGLSFTELMSRVNVELDSGQFNYHLQKLVGQFIKQDDEGYKMRTEGLNLYRTIQAGSFNKDVSIEPFDAGFDCYFCGSRVEASYDDGSFEMACPGCDHVYVHRTIPPNAADVEDKEELLSRVDQYSRHETLGITRGVCPICVNAVDINFMPGEEVWASGSEQLDVFVNYSCSHCGLNHYMSVGTALLYNPSLISFFHERECDVTSIPHWEFEFVMTDKNTEIRSRDPWDISLTVTCDGDSLELVVDEEMNVVEENLVEG